MCARETERQAGEGMRRTVLFSLPAKMETGRRKERRRRKERKRKKRGGESFVSITLTEMESYYRYSQCCQRLRSEFFAEASVCRRAASAAFGVCRHVLRLSESVLRWKSGMFALRLTHCLIPRGSCVMAVHSSSDVAFSKFRPDKVRI